MIKEHKPVVVLGLGPSGLFLTRQLSNITDNIYGVGREDDVGLYSKHIDKSKRYYARTEQELLQVLEKIADLETEKPVLYVCSDQYLTLLLESDICWQDYVTFSGSDLEQFALINDKNRINAYCAENQIRIPLSVTYEQFCQNEDRQYPVIIKWNEKKLNMPSNPVGKVRVCMSEEAFSVADAEIRAAGMNTEELFVQTYVRGNNRWQYSVGGYYQNGEQFAAAAVNQVKQYPQGISAEVIMADDAYAEKVMQIASDFAKSVGFTGFMEMEFKIDEQTHEAYLLDVNPRPWGWVSILGQAYPDFYRVLLGEKPREAVRKTLWQSKMRVQLAKKNPQNASVLQDVSSYARAYDIYDKHDRLPGIMIYVMAVKKLMKR